MHTCPAKLRTSSLNFSLSALSCSFSSIKAAQAADQSIVIWQCDAGSVCSSADTRRGNPVQREKAAIAKLRLAAMATCLLQHRGLKTPQSPAVLAAGTRISCTWRWLMMSGVPPVLAVKSGCYCCCFETARSYQSWLAAVCPLIWATGFNF